MQIVQGSSYMTQGIADVSKIRRIPRNWLLVKIKLPENEAVAQTKSGIYLSTIIEPNWYKITTGYVIRIPDRLQFGISTKDEFLSSLEFDTECEIRTGDKIHFNYTSITNKKIFYDLAGNTHIFIRYDSIYCGIRDGEVIPVNGWVLMEHKTQEMSSAQIEVINTSEYEYGLVKYVGKPVMNYKFIPGLKDDDNIYAGQEVCYKSGTAIQLENPLLTTIQEKPLLRIHRRWICAERKEGFIRPLKHWVEIEQMKLESKVLDLMDVASKEAIVVESRCDSIRTGEHIFYDRAKIININTQTFVHEKDVYCIKR